jgi:hypothetical protein
MRGHRQDPLNTSGYEHLTRELEIAARQESEARKELSQAEKLRAGGFITQEEYRRVFQAWSTARLVHERKMYALSAHLQTLTSDSVPEAEAVPPRPTTRTAFS